jgi:LPPG:FO 2-phospho-L-lactate transferase
VSGHVVALCDGVGRAKLAHGLQMAPHAKNLSIVVNTGDDLPHLGLSISSDLDSVMYALPGSADPLRGGGRHDETWTFMEALKGLGVETWFRLGHHDLAMHMAHCRLAQVSRQRAPS